jgi:hypothetical protein
MSILTYNGITLPYANCTYFNQTPVYDPTSQTDHMLTRFEISITAVINTAYAILLDGGDNTIVAEDSAPTVSNPAQIMKAIRQKLIQPRMALSFTFNGYELIPQPQTGINGTVDAFNGPKTECQIFSLTNETFLVKFHVVAHYWENNETINSQEESVTTNRRASAVISNRWSEQVVLDASGYSTKIRTGRYIIRSDNAEGVTADIFRNSFAVCSLPAGFVRVSSDYDISPDGLGSQYRIVDREVFKLPPTPAFESSGKYVETVTRNGAWHEGRVSLSLRAPKDVSQVQLIDTAIGIAAQKLKSRGAAAFVPGKDDPVGIEQVKGAQPFGLLTHCALVIDMYDNSVEVILQVLLAARTIDGGKKRIHGVAALTGGRFAAFTPGSEDEFGKSLGRKIPYVARGTAKLLLSAAAYFDANLSTERTNLGRGQIILEDNREIAIDVSDNAFGSKVQTGGRSSTPPGEAGRFPEDRRSS